MAFARALTRLLMFSTVVSCALLADRMARPVPAPYQPVETAPSPQPESPGTGPAAPIRQLAEPLTSAQEAWYGAHAEAKGKPMNANSLYTSNLQTAARFSSEDLVPDGNLAKPVWKKAKWVKFDHDAFTLKRFPGAETAVASFWTSEYVYVAFRCKYATLNTYEGEDPAKERWELWNRDVVEVFANPEPQRVNHYYEFEVAPNNQWIDLEIDLDKTPFNDAGWNSGFEHATRVDAPKHLWTCEMRIPLRSLNVQRLEPGTEWRVNFYRADGPGGDTQRRFLSWSPIQGAKRSFHVPTSFGVIRFVKEQ